MEQMGWLAWVVIGVIAGWLANVVVRTNYSQGCLADLIVGVVGALIGGFVFQSVGKPGVTGFNLWSIFVAFIGAVILLVVLRLITGRRTLV
jgi:uncharacterized membrane protein YeaQ/YmgE (transglycosylase-associated protein family)